MTTTEETTCRLCLSKMESDNESLDESKKKNLLGLLLELNLLISESPLICKRCARSLEHASEFKKTCLQTEEIITAFVALSDKATLDLKEIYLSENVNSNLHDGEGCICRLCLTCVKKDMCLSLGILKENMIVVRDMLPKCLPELDFSLTFQPVVCTSCIRSMERFFTFSQICSEVEQKILEHYHSLNLSENNKIKLNDVVQSITDNLMGKGSTGKYDRPAVKITKDVSVANKGWESRVETIEDLKMNRETNLINMRYDVDDSQIEKYSVKDKQHVQQTGTSDKPILLLPTTKPNKIKRKRQTLTSNRKPKLKVQSKSKPMSGHNRFYLKIKLNSSSTAINNKNNRGNLQVHDHCANCMCYTEGSDSLVHKSTCSNETFKGTSCHDEDQIRIHEPPLQEEHKCILCPFKAKKKNHLAVHNLSHNPKKKYKCDLCTYETRRKNLLLTHVKVHRELREELLKCVLCPYETKVNSAFKSHMENHSKVSTKPNAVAQDLMIIKEGGNLRLVRKNDKQN